MRQSERVRNAVVGHLPVNHVDSACKCGILADCVAESLIRQR